MSAASPPHSRDVKVRDIADEPEPVRLLDDLVALWSGAMMLEHLGHADAAQSIDAAFTRVLAEGRLTYW